MGIGREILHWRAHLPAEVTLVAVSKTVPPEAIMEAYDAGQRIFGENRVQELVAKAAVLPRDISWFMIGNLQTNKVKYIAPFVTMIQSVDSPRLLEVIDREARKNGRTIDVLLEVFIASEETKSGWDASELSLFLREGKHLAFNNVRIRGLMGMATFTDDAEQVCSEFSELRRLFDRLRSDFFDADFDTLSMGMSGDWQPAVECGSTMVRIGSAIFGARTRGGAPLF